MPHRLNLFLFACGLAVGLVLPVQTGQAQVPQRRAEQEQVKAMMDDGVALRA